jgi:hypothetical protein
MSNSYDSGDLVRISAAFKDLNQAYVDPSVTIFTAKLPDGTLYTKQYGTDLELIKDSTGNFHIDLYVNQSGIYSYRFSGSGAVTAAGAGMFVVS